MNKCFKKVSRYLPDTIYLKLLYYRNFKKKLNLNNPQSYNEKLQWLKLNDRNPMYTKLVDKYEVREYVKEKIGEEYLVPLLGIWNNYENINFEDLPKQFVLKCTHDSGGVKICKNKDDFDIEANRIFFNECLKNNFYYYLREWPYKNVKPRIIAEQYINNKMDNELKDYKFFCFNGEPKFIFIASERQSNEETKFDFYDINFNHLPFTNGHPNSEGTIKKPIMFDKMVQLAKELSKDFIHVRVDFYEANEQLYFGELTFYHWSGLVPFKPENWDYEFGKYININQFNKKK